MLVYFCEVFALQSPSRSDKAEGFEPLPNQVYDFSKKINRLFHLTFRDCSDLFVVAKKGGAT